MPGPLPTGDAIRRNKPTIPTTSLPASGRQGPPPDPPMLYVFGPKGLDWWGWAWRTPQACGWDAGSLFMVARRALLEDEVDAVENRLTVQREMRELDDRLGLTPKGLAQLRWKIVADEEGKGSAPGPEVKQPPKRRLKAV